MHLFLGVLFCSCTSQPQEEKIRPMVYEGMAADELRKVLGEPAQIDTLAPLYSADLEQMVDVVKWQYEKRTVIIINDTIKNPNLKD